MHGAARRLRMSAFLEKFTDLGQPSSVKVARTSYVQMLKDTQSIVVDDVRALYRTVTLGDLNDGAIDAILKASETRNSPLSYIVLHPFHGAGERIPLASSSWRSQAQAFCCRDLCLLAGRGGCFPLGLGECR